MNDVNELLKVGRTLLEAQPALTEAEFRKVMLERFRSNDQGLQKDRANMSVTPTVGETNGLFAVFALPWIAFRWMGWRGRQACHQADMDEVVRRLRAEGHFAPQPA